MAPEDWLVDLARQHRLSPTQRQIVQRMLGMFPDVAFLSTIEIAELAGVSQPTVTRLATALGFAGFPEFRSALRDAVLSGVPAPRAPSLSSSSSSSSSPSSSVSASLSRPGLAVAAVAAVDQECVNLGAVRREVGGDRMAAAVQLLAGSSPLGVVGFRASAALADYFGYFARRVLPSVAICTDAATVADSVLELHQQGGATMLVFAMPRYPAATVTALRTARRFGLSTVVVADSALVPFADDADVLLTAPVGTGLLFDSHAAAVVLSITLLDAVAATSPQRTQQRLEAHESLLDTWVHDT